MLPCNWPALTLFLACSTQWRRAGMAAAPTGLDYTAVATTAAWLGQTVDADLLWRLRTLEVEALAAMIEHQARDSR